MTLLGEASVTLIAPKGHKDVTLNDFEIQNVIGRGTYGKVFLVTYKGDNMPYAMKALDKEFILDEEIFEQTKLEKDILMMQEHPFLIAAKFVFQTESKLFFVMHFARGGDLWYHKYRVM